MRTASLMIATCLAATGVAGAAEPGQSRHEGVALLYFSRSIGGEKGQRPAAPVFGLKLSEFSVESNRRWNILDGTGEPRSLHRHGLHAFTPGVQWRDAVHHGIPELEWHGVAADRSTAVPLNYTLSAELDGGLNPIMAGEYRPPGGLSEVAVRRFVP